MSSDANPLKKPAEDLVSDEPSSKKAKVCDEPGDNPESTADTKSKNNEHNSNNVPIKTANGNKPDKSSPNDDDANVRDDEGVDDEEDDDDEDDDIDGVSDPKIANCLDQVEGIQLEICNLNEKASEEILKVEQKFNKLRRPHFEKRNELLKDIPNFWLNSMANHPIIAPMIECAEDEDCLHYLINLDVEEFEDIKSGYRFKLHFVENPYIENEVIVKQFQFANSEDESAASTQINFKNTPKGQKLKQIVEESLAQNRRSRRSGQSAQHRSFFAWLSESCDGVTDEVAESIKEQIWPNPLEYFFATPEEEYNAVSDEDFDDEDEDEEIDDEELDDDGGVAVIGRDSGSEIELEGSEDESIDDEDVDDDELE